MERLRSRKAEVDAIAGTAARLPLRFEPAPTRRSSRTSIAEAIDEPLGQPKTAEPTAARLALTPEQEEESYTSRLLKAKKKAGKRD